MTFFLWNINFLASRAEYFYPGGSDFLAHAYGKNVLSFAKHSGTDSKYSFDKFFPHERLSFGGCYKSGMDKPIDVSGFLIDG